MKKITAFILCLMMVLSVLPAAAFAAETEPAIKQSTEITEFICEDETELSSYDNEITPAEEFTKETSSAKAAKKETRAIAPMTEEEAAAVAVQTWDISEAQDGSITMYLVPNGDETYSLYAFGAGPIQEISASSQADILAKYPWCMEALPVTTAYIGDGITTIGRYLFFGATIESVRIPSSVTIIGSQAFRATKLKSIDIPDSVTAIGSNCFVYNYDLETIKLPNGITEIPDGSFSYCTSLKTIDIPASVTTIGASCFYKCDALQSIDVAEGNPNYSSRDGIVYNKAMTEIAAFPAGFSSEYVMPDTITTLPEKAFYNNKKITSVVCSDNLTSVGQRCFYGCSALESITLSKNVKEYPKNCFYGTTALKSIEFPTNGITLGDYCFSKSGIENVNFENVASIGNRCFAASELSGEVVVPVNCDVYDGAFSTCNNLKRVTYKNKQYNVPNAYVHEDVMKMYQSDINDPRVQAIVSGGICNYASVMTGLNTLAHLNYTVDSMAQETIDSEYGIHMFHQHTNCIKYIAEHYGIETSASAGYFGADKIVKALSEGKLVYIKLSWDKSSGHGYILWGITEDGYVYASDPAYPDMAPTQMDLSLFTETTSHNGTYHSGNYTAYDMGYPYDLAMKTSSITASASVTEYPESYIFTANDGEKLGTTNGVNTYLGKSSDWTSYDDGTASTSLRFAYTPEATDYIYVLDYSDSMTKSTIDDDYTNMSIEKTVAYEAIEELLTSNSEARVSVVNFRGADEASYTAFTSNPEVLYDAIADATCQGFTSYADGLNTALEAMNSRTGDDANRKTVVVFVTDGDEQWWINDEAYGSYLPYKETKPVYLNGDDSFGVDEADTLRAAGAEIYSVILNPEATESAIANMAAIAGSEGKVFVASTIDELGEAFCGVIDAATLRSFTITDTIGNDFIYNGNLVSAEGTSAVIDETNRTITWTLENILPNTEYTMSFDIQTKRNSTGNFVTGDLPTNLGDAVATENGVTINSVETPVLHRDPVAVADGAQAHMIHKYTDITRKDNPALYTDGIRFCVSLDMEELQNTYEPGDKLAFAIIMQPLDKLQTGNTTNYLTLNIGANGALTSNGSFTFVNNSSAISKTKPLTTKNMITWTDAMDNATTTAALAKLLQAAGMNIYGTTEDSIQYSVYMMFSNASTRQAQADREIAYRGVTVAYKDGAFTTNYTFQRNNSATRIYNEYNYIHYDVINVKGAKAEDMMHGESEYNPAYESQLAAVE